MALSYVEGLVLSPVEGATDARSRGIRFPISQPTLPWPPCRWRRPGHVEQNRIAIVVRRQVDTAVSHAGHVRIRPSVTNSPKQAYGKPTSAFMRTDPLYPLMDKRVTSHTFMNPEKDEQASRNWLACIALRTRQTGHERVTCGLEAGFWDHMRVTIWQQLAIL